MACGRAYRRIGRALHGRREGLRRFGRVGVGASRFGLVV
ncbi:hypothetical protein LA76x_4243 [Lysobacter antibioticus]|uniref:Uncharacterized protein n=1 Tax=Lysobacter antibioticus TaxID=84531 RepID=A0A0S2FFS5_LYSAN|nr:hypothetical protein LA76x_4243 [Lysobacter antibioticus]